MASRLQEAAAQIAGKERAAQAGTCSAAGNYEAGPSDSQAGACQGTAGLLAGLPEVVPELAMEPTMAAEDFSFYSQQVCVHVKHVNLQRIQFLQLEVGRLSLCNPTLCRFQPCFLSLASAQRKRAPLRPCTIPIFRSVAG